MHPAFPLSPSSSAQSPDAIDSSPLLRQSRSQLRRPSQPLRGAAARLLRRASSRRLMLREPSVRVRETAAEQIEERQTDWAYSKPIVVLDILWNFAFVLISVAVLELSVEEKTDVPLRLWIIGYNFQCLFHIACVIAEFRRRRRGGNTVVDSGSGPDSGSFSGSDAEVSDDYGINQEGNEHGTSLAKHLESANTMFSFVWWIIGFYWVTSDTDTLSHESPQLYWLCVTFLAFDVIFVVICVALAGLIGIAVCCCLPCIIAVLYALADQEGASEEDIDRLPRFGFRSVRNSEKVDGEVRETYGGIMTELGIDSPAERVLSGEDAECCICLTPYEDGTELRELPCHHHFHSMCIDKWLHINATCPLCKFNVLKANDQSCNEEV